MKNIKYGVLFLALVGIGLGACNKHEDIIRSKDIIKKNTHYLSFDEFEIYGRIHNAFLTNVKYKFEPCNQVNSYQEAIEYINQFQQNYLETLNLTLEEKQKLSLSLNEHKRFVDFEYLYYTLFPIEENALSLFCYLNLVKDFGIIDLFEYNSLTELSILVKQSYKGQISYQELESFVSNLKSEWLKQEYFLNSETGILMAYVLSISLASLNWWRENPVGLENSSLMNNTKALPAWAATDIAGGIIGACASALTQYSVNGQVDMRFVGASALTGAITASTGAVGRLGNWIKKWF